jgi:hypothetical protein
MLLPQPPVRPWPRAKRRLLLLLLWQLQAALWRMRMRMQKRRREQALRRPNRRMIQRGRRRCGLWQVPSGPASRSG